MIRNPRNWLWLLPLLLFVTSPLWQPPLSNFLSPPGIIKPAAEAEEGTGQQSFIMDAVTITMSSWGEVEWVVNARQAFTVKSDKEIGMIDVDAVYTGGGEEPTLITSKRGLYDVNTSHLILIDNVVVEKPAAGQRLFSDLLHYYNDRKTIVSPGKVRLEAPDFTIRAGRLDYDLVSNGYEFSKRVICEFARTIVP